MTGLLMPADFADRADFDNANRGLLARLEPGVVKAADSRVVYDADVYTRTVAGDCPETVHPSLWRQCQLTAIQGLFEVTEGIYQVRGLDLSNMTLVEGAAGMIVIDPLISAECAAAGLALYREHRGDRPVTAVIYTHSHLDHFGGVLGVVDIGTDVPIVAPEHFLEHAVSENVYAGGAMLRRATYYGGVNLPVSATAKVGIGLGSGTSAGTVGLLAPTLDITHTGQEETLDGVRIIFQVTPGTEAPAEMNFYFPAQRALCLAENVTHNLHNLLTLRGAEVRDARGWSRYIAEAIELFADGTDVAFASHHWPTWGTGNVIKLMTEQRDLYAFLHDQTLRLLNQGYVGSEIAEMIEVPPALEAAWHTHGYYGSVSHNVKAIYQRYLGWYDGNPAHLWQHPPEAAAARYVQAIGGIDATIAKARQFADSGDLRFAAELASHAVFADPSREAARALLADVLTRLGYSAECATWRNVYLTGAQELHGVPEPAPVSSAGLAAALTITQLFDSVAIRIDGKRAWDTAASIRWHFTDTGETYRMELSNGALIHYPTTRTEPADLVITLTRPRLLAMLGGAGTDGVQFDGDPKAFTTIASLTDQPDPAFPIVTPLAPQERQSSGRAITGSGTDGSSRPRRCGGMGDLGVLPAAPRASGRRGHPLVHSLAGLVVGEHGSEHGIGGGEIGFAHPVPHRLVEGVLGRPDGPAVGLAPRGEHDQGATGIGLVGAEAGITALDQPVGQLAGGLAADAQRLAQLAARGRESLCSRARRPGKGCRSCASTPRRFRADRPPSPRSSPHWAPYRLHGCPSRVFTRPAASKAMGPPG